MLDTPQSMKPKWLGILRALVVASLLAWQADAACVGQEPLPYNNPSAVVDLAVGLWAWPLPIDFNGDGALDLVVSCPDTPSNGLYVFENPGSSRYPVFESGRRIGAGLRNVCVSYNDGRPRVLSPAVEFPDFLKSSLSRKVKLPLAQNDHPNRVRGNFWRYVDFDGDGKIDIVIGADDWTDYGWHNGHDASGEWIRGPLRGFVYVAQNVGTK